MQIDRDGNRVLLHVLAEIEIFSTIDDWLFETRHPYVQSVQRLEIPYNPAAWFGGPLSGTRRKAIHDETGRPGIGRTHDSEAPGSRKRTCD